MHQLVMPFSTDNTPLCHRTVGELLALECRVAAILIMLSCVVGAEHAPLCLLDHSDSPPPPVTSGGTGGQPCLVELLPLLSLSRVELATGRAVCRHEGLRLVCYIGGLALSFCTVSHCVLSVHNYGKHQQ